MLAHVPFDRMRDDEIREVARSGVAVIATLSVIDGFPGPDGLLPLLTDPELAARLTPRWRRVLIIGPWVGKSARLFPRVRQPDASTRG